MIVFLSVNGSARKFSPLSIGQEEEVAAYLRFVAMQETREQLAGVETPVASATLLWAKQQAEKITPGQREYIGAALTFRGLIRVLMMAGSISENDARDVLTDRYGEAFEVAAKCLGLEPLSPGEKSISKPLPMSAIMRLLTNEPYCHTPAEVTAMSLAEIAVIWSEAEQHGGGGRIDQQAIIAAAHRRKAEAKLTMWEQPSVWGEPQL
jgi:hypothetical protein